ncbi:hypothetical protein AC578_3063 [Pseudocercospora eumusae]|uniref:Uncharacterized protein n=1 Tax=Pseudocercospora eumusae TaxID=321146 RepID=A0A139H3X4_9PEZI|nr:hypothetical protein AC578_3063 [Pseudocercospora eumusae]
MTPKEQQTFTFETMAVVLYCVLESGITLGDKHYQLMSALDGHRSANAFNHQFRKVKARAKELKQRAGGGKKRGRKDVQVEEGVGGGDDEEIPRRKKAKTKVKEEKAEEEEDDDDDGLGEL